MSTPNLLRVTALLEAVAGLALLAVPAAAIKIVFGVDQAHPEALAIGRLGGAALLAIGVACWAGRGDGGSPSRHGLVQGALGGEDVVMHAEDIEIGADEVHHGVDGAAPHDR